MHRSRTGHAKYPQGFCTRSVQVDRLSRSLLDFAMLMERASARGLAPPSDLAIDTTSPSGALTFMNVMAPASAVRRLGRGLQRPTAAEVSGCVWAVCSLPAPGSPERIVQERRAWETLASIAEAQRGRCLPPAGVPAGTHPLLLRSS